MEKFDHNLITDPAHEENLKEWLKADEGSKIFWDNSSQLTDMAILAENITAIKILADHCCDGRDNPCYESMLRTSAKTSMETLLHVLTEFYVNGVDLNGREGLLYEEFLEASQDNTDPRVRRFVDRLSEFIDEDGLVPIIRPLWLDNLEDIVRDEVTMEEGRQSIDEVASRMEKHRETFVKWNEFLKHACDPIVPTKSSRN